MNFEYAGTNAPSWPAGIGICHSSRAFSTAAWSTMPQREIRDGGIVKQVVAALIFKDGKILVCQRTRHQTMPLKWEFPGGKIEEGEQPRDALRRELDEELGIQASVGDEVARIRHQYKNGSSVELRFFVVREYEGNLENKIFRDMRWAERSELPSFDFLEADLELVKDLASGKIM